MSKAIAPGTEDAPLDLLIVGAGISGIDLAHHVSHHFPHWSWEIHDVHEDLGGTWHTFTYPGIRSDSDMATFSFPFYPWPHEGTLGQGADIKEYIRDAARDCGALQRLRFCSWIKNANWLTSKKLYAITVVQNNSEKIIYARRVHYASGYFSHSRGFRPTFPGENDFEGDIIHPQRWPDGLDCHGRQVVVIGSGATAITLVPALKKVGAHVTMLQRSSSYIAPLPEKDSISKFWQTLLPSTAASHAARTSHIVRDMTQYMIAQHAPWMFKKTLRILQRRFLSTAEIDAHFTPEYQPWDQRVCKAPNGDFFIALQNGARVVTDAIETLTPRGIRLKSGGELPADIIISATGLELELFGNATVSIDGNVLDNHRQILYRGIMLAGVPNLSLTLGYFNASWTLRADLVSRYMVRLWKMGEEFYSPRLPLGRFDQPMLDLDAGYIKRGVHRLPQQGEDSPWKYTQNILIEWPQLTFGNLRRDMTFGDHCLSSIGSPQPKLQD